MRDTTWPADAGQAPHASGGGSHRRAAHRSGYHRPPPSPRMGTRRGVCVEPLRGDHGVPTDLRGGQGVRTRFREIAHAASGLGHHHSHSAAARRGRGLSGRWPWRAHRRYDDPAPAVYPACPASPVRHSPCAVAAYRADRGRLVSRWCSADTTAALVRPQSYQPVMRAVRIASRARVRTSSGTRSAGSPSAGAIGISARRSSSVSQRRVGSRSTAMLSMPARGRQK